MTDEPDRDERRLELAGLGVLIIGLVVVYAVEDQTEDIVRGWSGLFQIAGVLTTALGLSNLRHRFSDRPSIASRIGRRSRVELDRAKAAVQLMVQKLIGRTPPPKVISVSASDTIRVSDSATARLGYPPPASTMPVPEQLYVIHLRLERLRIELEEGKAELARDLHRSNQALKEEARRRGEAVDTVRGLVKDLAVGGLRLGAIGVVLLVFGLALATWVPEIADLLPER